MTVISNPLLLKKKAAAGGGGGGDSAYQIEKSLRFNSADSSYLSRTPSAEGNRRTWTWSGWVKRSVLGSKKLFTAGPSGTEGGVQFHGGTDNTGIRVGDYNGSHQIRLDTSQVFRDASAWYHIVVVYDTTNSTAAERTKLYINGERVTSFSTATYPSQNYEGYINDNIAHALGAISNPQGYFDGYLADVHFIDGLALSPAAFGEFDSNTGVWNPKAFALPAPNTNKTWSGMLTGAGGSLPASGTAQGVDKGFDGSTDTYVQSNGGTNPNSITFTPTDGLAYTTSVEVNTVNSANNCSLNGGEPVSLVSDGWVTIAEGSGTINTLKFERASTSGSSFQAIRVDGVILVDGKTDAATRTNPNNGITWSTYGTFTNVNTPANIFDGKVTPWSTSHTDPTMASGSANSTWSWDLGSSHKITGVETITLHIWPSSNQSGSNLVKINDTDVSSQCLAFGETWVAVEIDDFTEFQKLEIANNYWYLAGIAINGHLLIDSSVDNSFHLKFNDTSTTAALGYDSLSTKTIRKSGGFNADDDKDDLVLAIPGDTIVDVHHTIKGSGSAKSLTNTNCTTSTTTSHFYGTSTHLNGTNAKLTTTTDSSDFDISGGTFTFECWFMSGESTSTSKTIITTKETGGGTGALELGINQNKLFCYSGDNQIMTTTQSTATVSALTTDKWHHLAVTRDGTTWRWFVDGELAHSNATSVSGSSDGCFLGYASTAGGSPSTRYLKANFQDIRFYKGTAKYTVAFEPPAPVNFTVTNLSAGATPGHPNNGTTWSSGSTSGGVGNASGSGGWSQAFDNNTGNLVYPTSDNVTSTLTLPSSISFTKLELYVGKNGTSGTNIVLNGTSIASPADGGSWPVSGGWGEVTSQVTSPLSTIGMVNVGGQGSNIRAIRINDTVVQDGVGSGGEEHQDSLTDTPTNYGTDSGGGTVRGNYCTWNPLMIGDSTTQTFSQGNLEWKNDGADAWTGGTLGVTKGSSTTDKWYWEIEIKHGKGGYGICNYNNKDGDHTSWGGGTDRARIYLSSNGKLSNPAGGSDLTYGSNTTCVVGDIVGVALDLSPGGTSGKITFYKNGTSLGVAHTDIDTTRYWTIFANDYGENPVGGVLNAGQRAFKYTPPTDHKCLCTGNFTDTFSGEDAGTVNNPSKYFDIATYTGTGADHDIKGLNFQPDMVWIKSRENSNGHILYDAVRGATKKIHPHLTAVEGTETNGLKTFNDDGFTVGSENWENQSGIDIVSWCWDAGTAAGTPINTGGITPSGVWKNRTAGFSMSKYTGTGSNHSIPHDLGTAPDWYMVKRLGDVGNWVTIHTGLSGDAGSKAITLESDNAEFNDDSFTGAADSNYVYLSGSVGNVNASGDTFMLYAWTAIAGYSAFGKYTGNDLTNGPFVYTGFRPRWIMIKNSGTGYTKHWHIYDTARDSSNEVNNVLFANESNGGYTYEGANDARPIDILSNGFRIRESDSNINTAITYIYSAFAEHPLKTARAR